MLIDIYPYNSFRACAYICGPLKWKTKAFCVKVQDSIVWSEIRPKLQNSVPNSVVRATLCREPDVPFTKAMNDGMMFNVTFCQSEATSTLKKNNINRHPNGPNECHVGRPCESDGSLIMIGRLPKGTRSKACSTCIWCMHTQHISLADHKAYSTCEFLIVIGHFTRS